MHTSGLGQLRTGNGDTSATGGLVGSGGLAGGTDVAVGGIHRDVDDGGTGVAVASTHQVVSDGGIGVAVSGTHGDVGDADTNTADIKHTPTNSVSPPAIQTQPEYQSSFRASAARSGWTNSTWPSSTAWRFAGIEAISSGSSCSSPIIAISFLTVIVRNG